MRDGHQWIHFDAQFPLKLGHDIQDRFGPAGELLFILFLCACKRSFPQGQINYRTEEEARVLLGANFDFADDAGAKWTLEEFWKWCGMRRVTRSKTRARRQYVFASRWEAWEDAHNVAARQRKRRSRDQSVTRRHDQRGEVGGVRGEVGGVSISPYPHDAPASDDPTSVRRRGNGSTTSGPKDPLVDRIRQSIPGTGDAAARQVLKRLRAAGVGETVIDEAIGYAAANGANTARYVEEVATDWMTQRDPTWSPQQATREPHPIRDALGELLAKNPGTHG